MNDLALASDQNLLGSGNMLEAFAEFLQLDVANGDASADTIRGYRAHVEAWVRWCVGQAIDPALATPADVKSYRQSLIAAGYKPASIGHKLTIIRRFYEAAVLRHLRADNPVAGVRPPKNKRAAEDMPHLSEVDLVLLLREIPKTGAAKDLRDRAMLGLMGLMGLRTVEIHRANVGDLQGNADSMVLLVHGKAADRLVYLRPDVAAALLAYLQVRGDVPADAAGIPLFTAVGNRASGHRISRRGVRQVVDSYLRQADLKRPRLSNHALRHTAATLAYKYSRDLRAVQDMLGHADPKTTARYAHVVDRAKNNPALAVPVTLEPTTSSKSPKQVGPSD